MLFSFSKNLTISIFRSGDDLVQDGAAAGIGPVVQDGVEVARFCYWDTRISDRDEYVERVHERILSIFFLFDADIRTFNRLLCGKNHVQ